MVDSSHTADTGQVVHSHTVGVADQYHAAQASWYTLVDLELDHGYTRAGVVPGYTPVGLELDHGYTWAEVVPG